MNGYLLPAVTAGAGGYWHEFDWNKSLTLAAPIAGLPYQRQLRIYGNPNVLAAFPWSGTEGGSPDLQ